MIPAVEAKLAFHDEAFISRDAAGEVTGLEPTSILNIHQKAQEREVGILCVTRRGKRGMIAMRNGDWRGEATRWILDMDAYTPTDIPALELENEAHFGDFDSSAVAKNFLPTAKPWMESPESYRLILALIHHVGLNRVKVSAKQAAEILGKHRATGWRTLKALEKLGYYRDGWVDYAVLLVSPDATYESPKLEERTEERRTHRWSVFTREGWAVRVLANQMIRDLPLLRQGPPMKAEFSAHVRDGKQRNVSRAIRYFKEVMEKSGGTGRPLTPNEVALYI